MKKFDYEIIKEYKILSEKNEYTKEINLIKYENEAPLIDIRRWKNTEDKKIMLKGITLTKEEFEILKACINDIEF